MSLGHGASIVRNGLILHLDAANPKSYPGSGTTWNDLSGGGRNFTLYNSSYYSYDSTTKSFDFNRTTPPTAETGGYASLNGTGALTSATYLYNNHTTAVLARINNKNPTGYDATETQGSLLVYRGWHSMFYYSSTSLQYSIWNNASTQVYAPNFSIGASGANIEEGKWFYAVVARSGDTLTSYINGVSLGTTSFATPVYSSSVTNTIRIGVAHDSSSQYSWHADCNVATVKMYNRALSASEIKQNFEALRGRYGI